MNDSGLYICTDISETIYGGKSLEVYRKSFSSGSWAISKYCDHYILDLV